MQVNTSYDVTEVHLDHLVLFSRLCRDLEIWELAPEDTPRYSITYEGKRYCFNRKKTLETFGNQQICRA